MTDKRKDPPSSAGNGVLVKRQRQAQTDGSRALTIGAPGQQQKAVIQAVKRTSALRAPIMELTGHAGEVFACRFDSTGNHIASGSFDRTIREDPFLACDGSLIVVLWNTYGDCDNYGIIEGHKGAVLDLQWSRDSKYVYSASADHTLGTWDTETGERLRKHVGHEDIVNSVSTFRMGAEVLASGSDDCTVGVIVLSFDVANP